MNRKINLICFILLFFFMICAVSAADNENETLNAIDHSSDLENTTYPTALSVSSEKTAVKSLVKQQATLKASDVSMHYKDGSKFTTTLKDKNNNAISNVKVKFTVNGQTYTKVTNSKGSVSLDLNFKSGSYVILSVFDGTNKYFGHSIKNTINIKSTIKCGDFKKIYKSSDKYSATFYNKQGKLLINTSVKITLNSKTYTVKTDSKGIGKLAVNLKQGKYNISITNSKTLETITKIVSVTPLITGNVDITKYYKNTKEYKVKIINSDGKSAGSGKKVTFNVNGVNYVKTTDKDGYARINVNLKPGTFVIKALYDSCVVANKIYIKSLIQAKDLVLSLANKNKFDVKIVDSQGKIAAKQKVTIKVDGKTYTKVTNSKGIASINLYLKTGTYSVVTSYNGLKLVNKVVMLSSLLQLTELVPTILWNRTGS